MLPTHSQHQALRHKLPSQPGARCAQRAADSNFAPAALRAHQHQAGYVHTGNQQQQGRPAQQHPQNRADIANDHIGQRQQVSSPVGIRIGILLLQLTRNRHDVGEGGRDGDPVPQPGDAQIIVTAAMLRAVIVGMQRSPELRRLSRRKMKAARQHPDDRGRGPIQGHRLPQGILPSTKPPLPRGVAQQNRARGRRQILARTEIASQHRGNAQRAKESVAYASAIREQRTGRSFQKEAVVLVHIHRAENFIELLPVEIIEVRKMEARAERIPLE